MKNHPKNDVNRRHFLKSSGKVAAASAVLSQLPIERVAHAAGDETVSVALVGCGGRGTGAASQALSSQKVTGGQVKLVAMADAFRDRLDRSLNNLSKQHKKQVEVGEDQKFVGPDAFKEAIKLADVVILTTPPGFRPYHFEEAVKQGKNVFMEKPVATDPHGVRKVLEVAREARKKNLKVGVGLQRHHHAGYQEAIRRIHDGELGDITSMRAYWNGGGVWDPRATREQVKSEMEYQLRNWYYYVWLCGDHITEQHIHNLDIMNWVKQGVNSGNDPIHPLLKSVQAGFPILAEGMGGRQVRIDKKYGEIFDHHFVEFTYADGSKGYSQCRHIRGCKNSVNEYATGTKGRAFVSRQRFFSHKGELGWSFGGGAKNAYQVEHDRLFAAIRENQPHVEAEYGAMSTMTSILGRLATYTGQGLKMADVLKSEKVLMPDDIAYEKGVWKGTPPSLPDKDGVYPVAVPGNSEWIKKLI